MTKQKEFFRVLDISRDDLDMSQKKRDALTDKDMTEIAEMWHDAIMESDGGDMLADVVRYWKKQ